MKVEFVQIQEPKNGVGLFFNRCISKKNKKAHARFPWVHGNKEGLYLGSVLKKINQQI